MNFAPTTVYEAYISLASDEDIIRATAAPQAINLSLDYNKDTLNVRVVSHHGSKTVAEIVITDLTDFHSLSVMMQSLLEEIKTYNENAASIEAKLQGISSQCESIVPNDIDPNQFHISVGPCLYVDEDGTYAKLRFGKIGVKKSRSASGRTPIDDDFVRLYINGRVAVRETTEKSIAAFVNRCKLPYQIITKLASRILGDKDLSHKASIKPINISGLSEFGSLSHRWMVESPHFPKPHNYGTNTKPIIVQQDYVAIPNSGPIIPIRGKKKMKIQTTANRFYVFVPKNNDIESVELSNPKRRVAVLLTCGVTNILYLSDHSILVSDPKKSKAYTDSTSINKCLSDMNVWAPINPIDEWTRIKVHEAIASLPI